MKMPAPADNTPTAPKAIILPLRLSCLEKGRNLKYFGFPRQGLWVGGIEAPGNPDKDPGRGGDPRCVIIPE